MYHKLLCLSIFLFLQTNVGAQIVHIPDANFKAALLGQINMPWNGTDTIDLNWDGEIQVSEAQAYSGLIDVSNRSITNFTGIEAFINLTRLKCNNNQISVLDVSANTALEFLSCANNQLSFLDVSLNTALTDLSCANNQLSFLDVSLNTALMDLSCANNQLNSIDVSANTALEAFSCNNNQLSFLDVSLNVALTDFFCYNNQLTSLDVSANSTLNILSCFNNQLTSLDVSTNLSLTTLNCRDNQLGLLNVTGAISLIFLECYNNQLNSLDVSSNTALFRLNCSNNKLYSLNLSGAITLSNLFCNDNNLLFLDVSSNRGLRNLGCMSNQFNFLDLSSNLNLSQLWCADNSPFLQICVSSIIAVQSQPNWNKDPLALYIEQCYYKVAVIGNIAIDENINCEVDSIENGIKNILLLFDNGIDKSYALTNDAGYYQARLDTGNYTVTPIISAPHPYWELCPNSQQVIIDTNYQIQTINFALQETIICPYLEVEIATPLLRRCFNSTYYVDYCNTGTAGANNAYIEVELDTNLYFNSSSIPLVGQIGNIYRFNVGSLPRDTCGRFSIDVTISCHSQLGQIHCVEAHIYPDSLCLISLPNIHIANTCLTDTVLFVTTNYADAITLPYLLLEDTIVVDTGSFALNMGQSVSLYYPTNISGTATYQLVLANESSRYYTASKLVGCDVNSAAMDLLYLPNLSQGFGDIDCTPNRGSYDPNDKTGYPLGYDSNHYIQPNSTIDYHIRFQNTGTDTAIFINIFDTISSNLDLGTLRMGVASHPYTVHIMPSTPSEEQVLRFQFNPIYLPDSNVNEPASNGFIEYSIAQVANLSNGTIINNSASIYFDYNAPIQTNTTLHTICDNCHPENITNAGMIVFDLDSVVVSSYKVVVIPNPFSTETRIEVQGYTGQGEDLKLEIYDVMGRLQGTLNGNKEGQFLLQRGEMPTGVHFFRISENGHLLQSGRLSVGE